MPKVSSLTYDSESGLLICESTNGPATTVTWNRNGIEYQQSQRIIDKIDATYHNILSINSTEISLHEGLFSCHVRNQRGESQLEAAVYRKLFIFR